MVLWAIIEGPGHGWDSAVVVGPGVAGLAVFGSFFVWEAHTPSPMLPPDLPHDRHFSLAAAGLSLGVFGLMGTLFVQTQFLQFELGYPPLQAGLRIFPLAGRRRARTRQLRGRRARSPATRAGAGTLIPTATNSIVGSVLQGNSGVGSASNVVAFQLGGALRVFVAAGAGAGTLLVHRPALRFSAAWTSPLRSPPESLCSERSSCSHDFRHTVGRSPELPRRCPAQAQRRQRTRRAE